MNKKLTFKIFYGKEDGGWIVTIKEWPYFSVYGKTFRSATMATEGGVKAYEHAYKKMLSRRKK